MTSVNVVPEIKQVLGAMLFGARQPVSIAEMRCVMTEVAETHPEECKVYAKVTEADVVAALGQLKTDLAERHVGVRLVEAAGGFRFQTDAECGPWLRHLLDIGKPARLSRPTLETLAIIAYRQPVTRAEIEGVRGVTVDTIVRNLLELQLIRIVGRSSLPGRPLLLGTTQLFLDHFGLKDLKELPGIEQLCRKEEEFKRRHRPVEAEAGASEDDKLLQSDGEPAGDTALEDGGKASGETPGEEETKQSNAMQGCLETKAEPMPEEDADEAAEDDGENEEDDEDDGEEDGEDDDEEDDDDDDEEDDDETQSPSAKKG
jgi:segregation and condensation protein B